MNTLDLHLLPGRCPDGFAIAEQHPQLCACAAGTPSTEWQLFKVALAQAAKDGVVHQSAVRPLLRGRIQHKHIGTLYRRARSEGLLVEVDHERSDDVAGRNAGRLEPIYELRAA